MTREEAINELKYEWDYMLEGTGIKGREKEEADRNEDFRKVYQANMMAIAALKEQKTGKWIDVRIGRYMLLHRCSNCSQNSVMESKYCSYCGAKMEVEDGTNIN